MSLLQAIGIGVTRQGRTLLDRTDMTVVAGEVLGIIGANGAGKSTLLRVLAGIEAASRGQVLLQGDDVRQLSPRLRAQSLGYHAQNPELHWPLPVHTIVALGRLPYARSLAALSAADRAALARAIGMTRLEPLLERRGDTLSGGERARVHIARLLAGEHHCLLADEPTANLDPRFQIEIMGLLRAHARAGGGTLIVLHDLAQAARYCDRLLLLKDGRVQACGTPREVLDAHTVANAFEVSPHYFDQAGIGQALDADVDAAT